MGLLAKKALPNQASAGRLGSTVKTQSKTDLPLNLQSDEELMQAYQSGNANAFQVLLGRHHRPVSNFIFRFLRNEEAVEEAFQEVFLRVVKNAKDYKKSAKFTTWLYTITRNFCIDELRKRKFRNHAALYNEDDVSGDRFVSEDEIRREEAYEVSTAKQAEGHLDAALTKLPVEQREVFLLRHFQGLPFDEIARVSGTSVNTVKSRMRYALQSIQKHFAAYGILGDG